MCDNLVDQWGMCNMTSKLQQSWTMDTIEQAPITEWANHRPGKLDKLLQHAVVQS